MAFPTYTPKFGGSLSEPVYDTLFGYVPTLNPPHVYEHQVAQAQQARDQKISQLLEKMKPFLSEGEWVVHVCWIPVESVWATVRSDRLQIIDNKCNYYYSITDDRPERIHGSKTSEIPLSDSLIAAIKKLSFAESRMEFFINSGSSNTHLPAPFVISTTLESYRAHARTEGLLHEQAKALEESRAMNKMLEARLSVLEAFLAPKPTPPKEVDLLNLSDPGEPPTLSVTEIT